MQDVAYTFKVDDSIAALTNTPDVAADGAYMSTINYTYQYDGLNRLIDARGEYEKAGAPQTPLKGGLQTKQFERKYSYAANGNLLTKNDLRPGEQ